VNQELLDLQVYQEILDGLEMLEKKGRRGHLDLVAQLEFLANLVCLGFQEKGGCLACQECRD
jgi:hypothetical protein